MFNLSIFAGRLRQVYLFLSILYDICYNKGEVNDLFKR